MLAILRARALAGIDVARGATEVSGKFVGTFARTTSEWHKTMATSTLVYRVFVAGHGLVILIAAICGIENAEQVVKTNGASTADGFHGRNSRGYTSALVFVPIVLHASPNGIVRTRETKPALWDIANRTERIEDGHCSLSNYLGRVSYPP